MALKFRRGTTAQQSGSLAFGEPFVNTTLGTLLVGGPNGDIVLSTSGTGSTGNFGAISGSGLDITGDANIAGNLSLGGNITIGNQTSDVVNVIANLSSSLIPSETNVFDLGSNTKIWRDLYISTGSIKFVAGTTVVKELTLATINGLESATGSNNTAITNINSFTSSANTSLSNLNSTTASLNTSVSNLNSFTSSINTTIKSKLDADGVVSGSSQITLSSTTGFSTYSTSVDSRIATEKGRVDAILLAADADKDSFAEIVTLINSVDTTNDNAFASFYTASVGRLNNLELTSASLLIETSNLETFSGSTLTRLTALESSASTALSTNNTQTTSITNLNSTTASLLIETANLEAFTSSINTTIKSKLDADGVISSSAQLTTTFDSRYLNTGGDGVVSGSAQIDVSSTTGDIALGTRTSGNYVASLVAGTNITLSNNTGEGATPTIGLTNNTISGISLGSNLATLTIGTGLSGTSYNGSTAVTIANTGVTSNVAGTGVSVSGATGAVTISIGQAVATSSNVQFNSLGIGMAASATAGRIDATNDIVAFSSSDIRFKENIKPIENAIDKIRKISGNTYDWKEENKIEHGYEGNDVGVIAQEIEAVLPQLVQTRESGYKAVKYDKLVALLIEGIKEQQLQIEQLRIDLDNCRNKGL